MKIFRYIGVFSIVLFSFYYTEKIANYVLEKNDLYQEIENKKKDYEINSVSAIINDTYIIPGYNGIKVNVKDSYFNMKSLNVFNEFYLIYNEVMPLISLEQNKDKIILQGNKAKKSVSFILENDEQIIQYFQNNNMQADLLIDFDSFSKDTNFEYINNDAIKYNEVESLLNNYDLNKNLCVINSNIESICRKNEKYLLEPEIITNSNFINVKNSIESGKIYLVKKGLRVDNLKTIIKQIKFMDFNIISVSKLIEEKRS
ncbi:MAG: hypothetical protein E7172_02970 [Firmicutes bacterium]|nr:hypothetical protein [Bacillota bacterium]